MNDSAIELEKSLREAHDRGSLRSTQIIYQYGRQHGIQKLKKIEARKAFYLKLMESPSFGNKDTTRIKAIISKINLEEQGMCHIAIGLAKQMDKEFGKASIPAFYSILFVHK
ncbi:hypothetical protein ACOME3_004012 [Neoechinorhynchus agilis]